MDSGVTEPRAGDECFSHETGNAVVFQEHCSVCHTVDAPLALRPALSEADAWELIDVMRTNGLDLSDTEATAIVGYLINGQE